MHTIQVLDAAAGASRLELAFVSDRIVAEHRGWLAEAFGERADEAPGLLQLLAADGTLVRSTSGWLLGGALPGGELAWIEETGEEYRYALARSDGARLALNPPDDFWVIAGGVGHPDSTLAAAVFWRPAVGTSSRDPASRRDELWIVCIDRSRPAVVATRRLELTLPDFRPEGIQIGGSASAPRLLLLGQPDPGGRATYRALGLTLPGLETAWDTRLDPAQALAPLDLPLQGVAANPVPPTARPNATSLRVFSSLAASALGDGSGWLVSHGVRLKRIHSSTRVFRVGADGRAGQVLGLSMRDAIEYRPLLGEAAVTVLGVAGPRNDQSFTAIEAIWPDSVRVETLVDRRTRIAGTNISGRPDVAPTAAALHGRRLILALPARGGGFRAASPNVAGRTTQSSNWHQLDRPRVAARKAWLDTRADGR